MLLYQVSSWLLLALLSGTKPAAAASTLSCSKEHTYPGPRNPSFESGSIEGWTVVSGDAFGNASVSSTTSYFDGPFHQTGKYFLWGYQKGGDGPVGELRSSTFKASSVMSFLIGGGYSPGNLYVGLVRDKDGLLLLSQTGTDDEALIRIVWDTSAWLGQDVHVVVVDKVAGNSWGHINLDDVRTGCDALGDGDLTFTVMGQANQPLSTAGDTPCNRYGVDATRPQFHYTPYQGWINDPCGLIQWKGKHHRFAQFNPRSAVWDSMHWSHAVSDDGAHWKELPVALYPPYPNDLSDQSGRFTGSAVKDASGDMRLVFTEFTRPDKHPGAVLETQWTATSKDGISFDYYQGNPVIPAPPPQARNGFRDPKVFWDEAAASWRAVVGAGDENRGKILLYESKDLTKWSYLGVLFEGDGSTGNMWECPNFFPLDGKWVLFYGGNGRMFYHVGQYNGTTFTSQTVGLMDYGPAGYAGQWYKDEDGRDLAVSWMNSIGGWKNPSRINGWVGQHSFTRELFVRQDGHLGSRIAAEAKLLESGRGQWQTSGNINKDTLLGSSQSARIRLSVNLSQSTGSAFTLQLLASKAESVKLTVDLKQRKMVLDTRNAGYSQAGTWEATLQAVGGKLDLDILLDRSSIEIFGSDGTAVSALAFMKYTQSKDIVFSPIGGQVEVQFDMKDLESGWCSD